MWGLKCSPSQKRQGPGEHGRRKWRRRKDCYPHARHVELYRPHHHQDEEAAQAHLRQRALLEPAHVLQRLKDNKDRAKAKKIYSYFRYNSKIMWYVNRSVILFYFEMFFLYCPLLSMSIFEIVLLTFQVPDLFPQNSCQKRPFSGRLKRADSFFLLLKNDMQIHLFLKDR